jgi:hypothetical protein
MEFKPQKYYVFIATIFAATLYFVFSAYPTKENYLKLCIFKNITGYPCEFCGTGRSLALLRYGKIYDSLMMNPLGILVFVFISVSLVWMITDLVRRKETYFPAVNKKVSPLFIGFVVVFVILNWIWNIYKGN